MRCKWRQVCQKDDKDDIRCQLFVSFEKIMMAIKEAV